MKDKINMAICRNIRNQFIPIFCDCSGVIFGKFASKNVICHNCEKEFVLEKVT